LRRAGPRGWRPRCGGASVAARYPTRFLRGYVRAKIQSDPVYGAVLEQLRGRDEPLLDVGCGAGVLAAFLRESGLRMPIEGIDTDAKKIAVARGVGCSDARFDVGDALALPPFRGTVILLDVLHYLTPEERPRLLHAAIERCSGLVLIRDAVRDRSLRYRMTVAEETFARAVGWLRVPRLSFPTVDEIVSPFHAAGFESAVVPMWGRTPYNNYLFVFSRASSGMTKR
jgi:trans-aconitate methyltransferase